MKATAKQDVTCPIYCDNLGVVAHGNSCMKSLPEKQVQMDILSLLHRNIITLPSLTQYHHVQGQTDEIQSFHTLTLTQQLNVMADELAKTLLLLGIT